MESKWATQILQDMDPKKNKVEKSNAQGKKIVLIIIPIMFLLMMAAAVINNKEMTEQLKTTLLCLGGCLVFVMLIILLASKASKKPNISKRFIDSVNHVIALDGAELLDDEMAKLPNDTFKINSTDLFFSTDHYIVHKYSQHGLFLYVVIRKAELAKVFFHVSRYGLERNYQYDLATEQEIALTTCKIDGKKRALELEEFINAQVAGVEFPGHNLLV